MWEANEPFDVAIIGAGVVGCAVFREFVLSGLRTVLIEKDADVINGASKANSALLHTGFDALPGSLEAKLVRDGYAYYRSVREQLGLPLLETQAALVAWSETEAAALPGIVDRAHANGVMDVRLASRDEILRRESHLAKDLVAGVIVPGESVIDAWSAPLSYALQGLRNGGELRRSTTVLGGRLESDVWTLHTSAEPVRARVVVNCAGNFGDLIEAIARPSPFEMRPRKGQFVVLDKSASRLLNSILLPVPNERTKGVVVTRTAFGNLLVGPTAEEQRERDFPTTDGRIIAGLLHQGRRMIPALASEPVTASYAGLRPATQFKDYQIEALPTERWITVAGIRSTGLTSALGIGAYVAGLYELHFGALEKIAVPQWVSMPNLTEGLERPWMCPGRSEIICHCEMVTRAEIEAALHGEFPARSLGGLKRRTRVMMGRCQGFYCTRRTLELTGSTIPGLVEPLEDRT
ncbi:glycerol-3-phosphate dehydrogenase [Bradyrhizobium sp. JR7.2]|uniref:NAD(P)/FAD-dependent oxidoreductase n=1 Tax=Bradyrhizobium TaxID=374 RepID=UPI0024AFD0C3|nr:NAD(P)/FAD-dependent oxidoreductase [Bradyrhizobium barranii]WFT93524.1 NAD(P)/FAD-dependent oxidoreductase [Bradyrhizobium barranii]